MADEVVELENGVYREWSPVPEHVVIRKEFEEEQEEYYEEQLEDALDDKVPFIIIEPEQIGNETTKWIQMGNFLHKTGVLSGAGSLVVQLICPQKYKDYLCIPLGVLSLSCITLYNVSWQFDPCCKYQVEYDTSTLEKLQLEHLTSSSVVVLQRRDDIYRKRLHNCLGILVVTLFSWKVYKWYS
ncbi:transmembrane protein 11, mitochondrial-like [Rhopilema esculentum]|uniref:transmembrane protein 11, mitochondrial-like n=1 Tax=Rhopilema esculentum TaxID=499914 RepID=UPI0031D48BB9